MSEGLFNDFEIDTSSFTQWDRSHLHQITAGNGLGYIDLDSMKAEATQDHD